MSQPADGQPNGRWTLYVCDACGAWAGHHFGYSHARGNAHFQGGATRVCLNEPRRVHVAEITDGHTPFVPFEVAADAVAYVIRNGCPDDGSDCDEAVMEDARAAVFDAFQRSAAPRQKRTLGGER